MPADESAAWRVERIIAEELRRPEWTEADLETGRRSDPVKRALAVRLRRETSLAVGQ